jgi:hypothetical protein
MPRKFRELVRLPLFNHTVTYFLCSLSHGIVALFLPIYLYSVLHYSLTDIILIEIVANITVFFSALFCFQITRLYGTALASGIGYVVNIFFFLVLYNLDAHPIMMLLYILTNGMQSAFNGSNEFILRTALHAPEHLTKQTSVMDTIYRMAQLLAPFLGGVILFAGGKNSLAIVALLLTLASGYFNYHVPNIKPDKPVPFDLRMLWMQWWTYFKGLGDQFCLVCIEVATECFRILWPFILLLMISDNSIAQGSLGSLALILASIFSVSEIVFQLSRASFSVPFQAQRVRHASSSQAVVYKVTEEFSYLLARTMAGLILLMLSLGNGIEVMAPVGMQIAAAIVIGCGIIYSLKYTWFRRLVPAEVTVKEERM